MNADQELSYTLENDGLVVPDSDAAPQESLPGFQINRVAEKLKRRFESTIHIEDVNGSYRPRFSKKNDDGTTVHNSPLLLLNHHTAEGIQKGDRIIPDPTFMHEIRHVLTDDRRVNGIDSIMHGILYAAEGARLLGATYSENTYEHLMAFDEVNAYGFHLAYHDRITKGNNLRAERKAQSMHLARDRMGQLEDDISRALANLHFLDRYNFAERKVEVNGEERVLHSMEIFLGQGQCYSVPLISMRDIEKLGVINSSEASEDQKDNARREIKMRISTRLQAQIALAVKNYETYSKAADALDKAVSDCINISKHVEQLIRNSTVIPENIRQEAQEILRDIYEHRITTGMGLIRARNLLEQFQANESFSYEDQIRINDIIDILEGGLYAIESALSDIAEELNQLQRHNRKIDSLVRILTDLNNALTARAAEKTYELSHESISFMVSCIAFDKQNISTEAIGYAFNIAARRLELFKSDYPESRPRYIAEDEIISSELSPQSQSVIDKINEMNEGKPLDYNNFIATLKQIANLTDVQDAEIAPGIAKSMRNKFDAKFLVRQNGRLAEIAIQTIQGHIKLFKIDRVDDTVQVIAYGQLK